MAPLLFVIDSAQLGELAAARGPLRRLLRPPAASRGDRGSPRSTALAHRTGQAARHHRLRPARAQPRDLPGRRRRARRSTSPSWSTSCCASSPATRARSSPARSCSAGCGATSTSAGRGRSTSTSDGCGPSSARSTRNLIDTVRSVGYRFGQVAWHPGVTQRNGTEPMDSASSAGASAPSPQTTGA